MSITKIVEYKVEVQIPDAVWEKFKGEMEYEHKVHHAIDGFLEAGSDCYAEVFEWATFPTLADANECQQRLLEMVDYFMKKLKEMNDEN